jgi:peptidyl-prolyl cis-trans isomerase SurA
LLKKYPEDPGSKERCGQYQLNRNEKTWDPIFMSTAFRFKRRGISAPVKSKFGYHIIQMVQRNGDDAVIRHILRIPPVTEAEIAWRLTSWTPYGQRSLPVPSASMLLQQNTVMMSQQNFAGPCITNRDGFTPSSH